MATLWTRASSLVGGAESRVVCRRWRLDQTAMHPTITRRAAARVGQTGRCRRSTLCVANVWEGLSRVKRREDLSDARCPLRVITTVVSTPTKDRVIIDGGMKTFTSYPPLPYGLCVEYPEIKIVGMSVEHGHVDVSASSHCFRVGERLTFIPLHQEMCLNLHDELVAYRGRQVEVIWPVLGRGKVR